MSNDDKYSYEVFYGTPDTAEDNRMLVVASNIGEALQTALDAKKMPITHINVVVRKPGKVTISNKLYAHGLGIEHE